MKRITAVSLILALLGAMPGPGCYEALAQNRSISPEAVIGDAPNVAAVSLEVEPALSLIGDAATVPAQARNLSNNLKQNIVLSAALPRLLRISFSDSSDHREITAKQTATEPGAGKILSSENVLTRTVRRTSKAEGWLRAVASKINPKVDGQRFFDGSPALAPTFADMRVNMEDSGRTAPIFFSSGFKNSRLGRMIFRKGSSSRSDKPLLTDEDRLAALKVQMQFILNQLYFVADERTYRTSYQKHVIVIRDHWTSALNKIGAGLDGRTKNLGDDLRPNVLRSSKEFINMLQEAISVVNGFEKEKGNEVLLVRIPGVREETISMEELSILETSIRQLSSTIAAARSIEDLQKAGLFNKSGSLTPTDSRKLVRNWVLTWLDLNAIAFAPFILSRLQFWSAWVSGHAFWALNLGVFAIGAWSHFAAARRIKEEHPRLTFIMSFGSFAGLLLAGVVFLITGKLLIAAIAVGMAILFQLVPNRPAAMDIRDPNALALLAIANFFIIQGLFWMPPEENLIQVVSVILGGYLSRKALNAEKIARADPQEEEGLEDE